MQNSLILDVKMYVQHLLNYVNSSILLIKLIVLWQDRLRKHKYRPAVHLNVGARCTAGTFFPCFVGRQNSNREQN